MKPVSARFPVSSIRRSAPTPLLDLRALDRGALVVPEDRGPDHVACGVEDDEAVHLAGEPDPGHLASRGDLGEGSLGGPPPVLGVLLRPAGPRRGQRVPLRALASTSPSGETAIALTPVVPTSSPISTRDVGWPASRSARTTAGTRLKPRPEPRPGPGPERCPARGPITPRAPRRRARRRAPRPCATAPRAGRRRRSGRRRPR